MIQQIYLSILFSTKLFPKMMMELSVSLHITDETHFKNGANMAAILFSRWQKIPNISLS